MPVWHPGDPGGHQLSKIDAISGAGQADLSTAQADLSTHVWEVTFPAVFSISGGHRRIQGVPRLDS